MSDVFDEDDSEASHVLDKYTYISAFHSGTPGKDVWDAVGKCPNICEELQSDEQHVLEQVYQVVGGDQVTRKLL